MTKLPSVPAVPLPSPPSPEATGRQPAGLPSPAAAPAGKEQAPDVLYIGPWIFYRCYGPEVEIPTKDRHARDCGCSDPGGFWCKRAYPEDPDCCPKHGWVYGRCACMEAE